MKKIKMFLLLFLLLVIPTNTWAINEVNIYFFHSEKCDICKQEKIYLEALTQRYSNMRIYYYEINDSNNYQLMQKAKNMYNITSNGVPFTVIGDKAYLGFSQTKKALFQKAVYEYSKTTYNNKLGKELGISYRTDLEGEVIEYKDNDDYQIEETSGKNNETSSTNNTNNSKPAFDKYKVSFYLVTTGVVLSFIAYIIYMLEKRGRL